MDTPLTEPLVGWFAEQARDLPWRHPGTPAWSVLVSEVMLQQTPVSRVLPAYRAWLQRWPTPAALAADAPGEAVRMWGKLGYPRRALRLHACAVALVERFDGQVPAELEQLLELPGVGAYTARAVLAFAYRRRAPVVDINVRRVLARLVDGDGNCGPPATTRDLRAMEAVLPSAEDTAASFCAAVMELGAVVCTATSPRCAACPVREQCAWRRAGYPEYQGPLPRPQKFAGTDRQVRGLLLDVLRSQAGPVDAAQLDLSWPDRAQVQRALDSLVADGLLDPLPDGRFALPA